MDAKLCTVSLDANNSILGLSMAVLTAISVHMQQCALAFIYSSLMMTGIILTAGFDVSFCDAIEF